MVNTKRGFYVGLFTLALPIMAQTFINSLVNMIDTVMIGRLGTVEIAAFVFAAPVWLIYFLVVSEEMIKVVPGMLRLRSGKWLHDVTAES